VKTIYVTELSDGDSLDNEPFLLKEVMQRETKDGRPYLLCVFRDKSGQMGGVFWDVPPDIEGWVRSGAVVMVTGRVSPYRNALQITATDLNPVIEPNMSEYLPAGRRATDEMIVELTELIDGLAEPYQRLVKHILLEPAFLNSFASAPAARTLHHAWVGGLIEHTLSMATIAQNLAEHYLYVNIDLLLTGVLLHDMGKTIEYDVAAGFEFSHDGRLIGHVARAALIIERAATEVGDIPEEDLRQILHLILSHHGVLAYGSPVEPKTLEAVLLHQIDLLDSRVQGFLDHVKDDAGGGQWTTRSSYMFNNELLRPPEMQ
jgi:3'-5' exoribonuclease